jgi:hypothetical protein
LGAIKNLLNVEIPDFRIAKFALAIPLEPSYPLSSLEGDSGFM